MQRNILLLLFFLLFGYAAQAQQSVEQLKTYMASLKGDNYGNVPQLILQDQSNAPALLMALGPFYTDTLERVRSEAYSLVRRIGKEHPEPEVRQKAVTDLALGLGDPSSSVVGNVVRGLTYFKPADFSPLVRTRLIEGLRPAVPHKGALAKLTGYLQMEEAKPVLQAWLQDEKIAKKDKWGVYLALARMGDPQALSFTMSRVKRLPLNDDLVYDVLPDLAYTRQREAVDYLLEVLNSSEKHCEAADAELGGKILCGYRVMEILAPLIKGFPLTRDTSGDLETADYEKALQEVRRWFAIHPNYEII